MALSPTLKLRSNCPLLRTTWLGPAQLRYDRALEQNYPFGHVDGFTAVRYHHARERHMTERLIHLNSLSMSR